uniref:Uncharacterized protein n=1 Tax=uncultured marine thaumarchaeote SAT1000_11_C10 TaxID=1456377 RepID=A0A075I4Z5_9ARCH|nr:hypothetical protein [uncultured marine thaumarchaeote SAT1000_11_C10]
MPETGIDQINEETTPGQTDVLSSHLLDGKKKHDEDKNVETEEVQHLDKGTDYLTTMLLQQGIREVKTKSKKTPPKLDELKKMFVQNLVKSGYVTLGEKGRTVLTDDGKKFLDAQTKNAELKVELAKLKNLEYRKSLERQAKRNQKKRKRK